MRILVFINKFDFNLLNLLKGGDDYDNLQLFPYGNLTISKL